MRPGLRFATAALGCAVAAGGTAGPWQPPQRTTFTVAGHTMQCGPQATVDVELQLSPAGPLRHALLLDGRELPDAPYGPSDFYGVDDSYRTPDRTTAEPLVSSCAAPARHQVQLITGSAGSYSYCSITLRGSRIPGEGLIGVHKLLPGNGKSMDRPITNRWNTELCDVAWTVP